MRIIKELGLIFILVLFFIVVQEGVRAGAEEGSWAAEMPNLSAYLLGIMLIVWVVLRGPALSRSLVNFLAEEPEVADPIAKLNTEIYRDEKMVSMFVDKAKSDQEKILAEKRIEAIKPMLCDLQVHAGNLAQMVIGIAKKVDHCQKQAELAAELSAALANPDPEHRYIAHLAGQLANTRYSALSVADVELDNRYWKELIVMLAQYQGTLELYGSSYRTLGAATVRKVQELEEGFLQLEATKILSEVKLPMHIINGSLIEASQDLELKLNAPDVSQLEAGIAALEG